MTVHLSMEDVSFSWPGTSGGAQGPSPMAGAGQGFRSINFSLLRGDFALLRGPSGEGKSTLLRLLVRFEEVQQGRILLSGQDITSLSPHELRQRVGLVQQSPVMGAALVRDALLLPFTFAGNAQLPRPTDEDLRQMLDSMHLQSVTLAAEAEALSLGQKQRVALARTLLLKPEILLLDEPTSALDAESREAVEAQVEMANAAGTTVLMITHTDYSPVQRDADRAVRSFTLRDGQLVESGVSHE